MPAPSDTYGALIYNTSGVVAYWRLGEASSASAAADAVGSNPGTYSGSPTMGVTGPAALIGYDTAITIDGAGQLVSVTDATALHLGNGPLSIEFWIKRTATQGTNQGVVSKGSDDYYVRLDSSNRIDVLRSGTGSIFTSTGTLTDTASWHHIVVTKNTTTTIIYLDGAVFAGTGSSSAFTDNTSALNIGQDLGGGDPLHASVDELALYNVVLSAATVLSHFQAGIGSYYRQPDPIFVQRRL